MRGAEDELKRSTLNFGEGWETCGVASCARQEQQLPQQHRKVINSNLTGQSDADTGRKAGITECY